MLYWHVGKAMSPVCNLVDNGIEVIVVGLNASGMKTSLKQWRSELSPVTWWYKIMAQLNSTYCSFFSVWISSIEYLVQSKWFGRGVHDMGTSFIFVDCCVSPFLGAWKVNHQWTREEKEPVQNKPPGWWRLGAFQLPRQGFLCILFYHLYLIKANYSFWQEMK